MSDREVAKALQAATGRAYGVFTKAGYTSLQKRNPRAMATTHPNIAVILVDDLPTEDGTHFNTEGMLAIGQRLLEAYQKRLKWEWRSLGMQPKEMQTSM